METNKDLLLCENKYFLEKGKLENIVNFTKEKSDKPSQLKTEKVSSNVLLQVRTFLDKIKINDPTCVNIEENSDEEEDTQEKEENGNVSESKKKIQLDLMLFEQNSDTSSDDSDDE